MMLSYTFYSNMNASYQSWIRYNIFAYILAQLLEFERIYFKKLVFPRTSINMIVLVAGEEGETFGMIVCWPPDGNFYCNF